MEKGKRADSTSIMTIMFILTLYSLTSFGQKTPQDLGKLVFEVLKKQKLFLIGHFDPKINRHHRNP